MEKGVRFAVREGGKTIGSGVVTEIIDGGQLAEQRIPNPQVAGSIPSRRAFRFVPRTNAFPQHPCRTAPSIRIKPDTGRPHAATDPHS
jgi:hypothetical protein